MYSDTRAKRIYILIIKVKKLISFFSSRCFLKEIENIWKFGRTQKSLAHATAHVPTAFLVLPDFHSCFYNSIETWYVRALFCYDNWNKIWKFEVESGAFVPFSTATWSITRSLNTQGATDTSKNRKLENWNLAIELNQIWKTTVEFNHVFYFSNYYHVDNRND